MFKSYKTKDKINCEFDDKKGENAIECKWILNARPCQSMQCATNENQKLNKKVAGN